jgi:hypothetical protein
MAKEELVHPNPRGIEVLISRRIFPRRVLESTRGSSHMEVLISMREW